MFNNENINPVSISSNSIKHALPNWSEELASDIDHAIVDVSAASSVRMEKATSKGRRQKRLSTVMEYWLMAEMELQLILGKIDFPTWFSNAKTDGNNDDIQNHSLMEDDLLVGTFPIMNQKSLDKSRKYIEKALKEFPPQTIDQVEKQLIFLTAGKIKLLEGHYQEAMDQYFKFVSTAFLSQILNPTAISSSSGLIAEQHNKHHENLSPSATDYSINIVQPEVASPIGKVSKKGSFWKIIGVQGITFVALCKEICGRNESLFHSREALLLYCEVTSAVRGKEREFLAFLPLRLPTAMAIFRYGRCCLRLINDPLALLPYDTNENSATSIHDNNTTTKNRMARSNEIRGKLLYDAAVSLHMFLTLPSIGLSSPKGGMASPMLLGWEAQCVALKEYMSALEIRFRKPIYQNTFQQDTLYGIQSIGLRESFITDDESRRRNEHQSVVVGQPVNVIADLIMCTTFLEALYSALPRDAEMAQKGGAISPRIKRAISRLARLRDWIGLESLVESLFVRYAADAGTYGRLILALSSHRVSHQNGTDFVDESNNNSNNNNNITNFLRLDKIIRAGQIYLEMGGKEASVIIIWVKACLQCTGVSILARAIEILEEHYERIQEDGSLINTFRLFLGISLMKLAEELPFDERNQVRNKALTFFIEATKEDPLDHIPHLYLSMAHFSLRQLREAAETVQQSILLNPNQPLAWLHFANIKAAQGDMHSSLSLCNMISDGLYTADVWISEFKAALLVQGYGDFEKAIGIVGKLIEIYTDPTEKLVEQLKVFPENNIINTVITNDVIENGGNDNISSLQTHPFEAAIERMSEEDGSSQLPSLNIIHGVQLKHHNDDYTDDYGKERFIQSFARIQTKMIEPGQFRARFYSSKKRFKLANESLSATHRGLTVKLLDEQRKLFTVPQQYYAIHKISLSSGIQKKIPIFLPDSIMSIDDHVRFAHDIGLLNPSKNDSNLAHHLWFCLAQLYYEHARTLILVMSKGDASFRQGHHDKSFIDDEHDQRPSTMTATQMNMLIKARTRIQEAELALRESRWYDELNPNGMALGASLQLLKEEMLSGNMVFGRSNSDSGIATISTTLLQNAIKKITEALELADERRDLDVYLIAAKFYLSLHRLSLSTMSDRSPSQYSAMAMIHALHVIHKAPENVNALLLAGECFEMTGLSLKAQEYYERANMLMDESPIIENGKILELACRQLMG